jgi:hypothetical protein
MNGERPSDDGETMRHAALNGLLADAFQAPQVPKDLSAQVFAAIARDRVADRQQVRVRLEIEYRRAISTLNGGYLRRCRDAAIAGSLIVVVLGSAVRPLATSLGGQLSSLAPLLAGMGALGVGVLLGGIVMQDLGQAQRSNS